ncbi:hypothetical protein AAMO2058_001034600 [Amorphochlora amoebiformis]
MISCHPTKGKNVSYASRQVVDLVTSENILSFLQRNDFIFPILIYFIRYIGHGGSNDFEAIRIQTSRSKGASECHGTESG